MSGENTVWMQVPCSLEGVDEELDIMSMLAFIMKTKTASTDERHRIAQWFQDRYSKKPITGENKSSQADTQTLES